jgi:hypothetical protein
MKQTIQFIAETYYLIGEAMGRAMIKRLEGTPHGR